MMEPVARIVADALKELEKHPSASATVWSGKASHRFAKDAVPLVRLSDAEARIRELEAENELLKDRLTEVAHQREDVKWTALTHGLNKMSAEARAEAAEALLKEAGKALVGLIAASDRQPIAGNPNADRDWGLHNDWRGWFKKIFTPAITAARAIHHKIGVKDE